jgi:pimeloyl-ACP methyl ester carboxylesterase
MNDDIESTRRSSPPWRADRPMTTINANGVVLGVECFGPDDAPLVLLAGGTTMLSWPDALCERLAAGGRRVVRYDLRDSGTSTTADPTAPAYTLRDLAAMSPRRCSPSGS